MPKQTARQPHAAAQPLSLPPTQRFMPLLLVLFVGSGCAALIYEIVWFQLLQLVIGSSAVSLGVLLGTFMGGMCLGSMLLPRFVSPAQHPLRIYAMLEGGIGVLGLIVLGVVPLMGGLYTATAMHGLLGILWRGVICAICLLPPTLLMGATLPAIARWVESTPTGVSWLGFFYGSNIAGAVFGCLVAGFYLLRVHDMATTTVVAAAVNFTVAGIGFALSKRAPHRPAVQPAREGEAEAAPTPRANWLYLAIGLSGLTALGAEVLWTRVLSLMLGASVYTFSIILAVFLIGLGFGSSGGAWLARGSRPRAALGWSQMLLTLGVAWAAYMMTKSLPYWPINPQLSPSPWITFELDVVRSLVAVFPAALLWGASFPLAIAAVAGPGHDAGTLVGRVYAANTVGAIIGSILFSIIVIPQIGTQHGEQLLIGIAVISALVAFGATFGSTSEGGAGRRQPAFEPPLGQPALVAAAIALVVAVALLTSVPKVPDGLVAYGRFLPTYTTQPRYLYVGEGMNSSIAVSEEESGARNFHVAGKVEASSLPQDMRLQRMLGHISALLDKDPTSVLVVGFGAGVTAGSFVTYPGIKRIVICEIEPLIPRVVSTYFTRENYDVAHDLRVEIVYDDARHYILTTREKFDVITSDPIHPWVKGAATLYTKEYFELVKQHLNPGGVVTQWVPLYESYPDVVKSELATFFDVFPDGSVWSNDIQGQGYDVLLAGHATPQPIDVDSMQQRLARPDYDRVRESLGEVGFNSALSLLATYGGQARDLAPWLSDAQINRDGNLRLQYLAGMGLNTYDNARIYADMLRYRRFPDNLFVGAESETSSLRASFGGGASPP
ncbi:MAG TPA: fused MFS/spermidine synthase [Gemmatimonadaceae bacterium]|nr:fused MFS/spermidine synthase [Gemmatimonadaceae bacterium]